jgi:hypothetical protein
LQILEVLARDEIFPTEENKATLSSIIETFGDLPEDMQSLYLSLLSDGEGRNLLLEIANFRTDGALVLPSPKIST